MTTTNASAGEASSGPPASNNIDVERLTDKVYRLMEAEIRLGLARGEAAPRQSRATRFQA